MLCGSLLEIFAVPSQLKVKASLLYTEFYAVHHASFKLSRHFCCSSITPEPSLKQLFPCFSDWFCVCIVLGCSLEQRCFFCQRNNNIPCWRPWLFLQPVIFIWPSFFHSQISVAVFILFFYVYPDTQCNRQRHKLFKILAYCVFWPFVKLYKILLAGLKSYQTHPSIYCYMPVMNRSFAS